MQRPTDINFNDDLIPTKDEEYEMSILDVGNAQIKTHRLNYKRFLINSNYVPVVIYDPKNYGFLSKQLKLPMSILEHCHKFGIHILLQCKGRRSFFTYSEFQSSMVSGIHPEEGVNFTAAENCIRANSIQDFLTPSSDPTDAEVFASPEFQSQVAKWKATFSKVKETLYSRFVSLITSNKDMKNQVLQALGIQAQSDTMSQIGPVQVGINELQDFLRDHIAVAKQLLIKFSQLDLPLIDQYEACQVANSIFPDYTVLVFFNPIVTDAYDTARNALKVKKHSEIQIQYFGNFFNQAAFEKSRVQAAFYYFCENETNYTNAVLDLKAQVQTSLNDLAPLNLKMDANVPAQPLDISKAKIITEIHDLYENHDIFKVFFRAASEDYMKLDPQDIDALILILKRVQNIVEIYDTILFSKTSFVYKHRLNGYKGDYVQLQNPLSIPISNMHTVYNFYRFVINSAQITSDKLRKYFAGVRNLIYENGLDNDSNEVHWGRLNMQDNHIKVNYDALSEWMWYQRNKSVAFAMLATSMISFLRTGHHAQADRLFEICKKVTNALNSNENFDIIGQADMEDVVIYTATHPASMRLTLTMMRWLQSLNMLNYSVAKRLNTPPQTFVAYDMLRKFVPIMDTLRIWNLQSYQNKREGLIKDLDTILSRQHYAVAYSAYLYDKVIDDPLEEKQRVDHYFAFLARYDKINPGNTFSTSKAIQKKIKDTQTTGFMDSLVLELSYKVIRRNLTLALTGNTSLQELSSTKAITNVEES